MDTRVTPLRGPTGAKTAGRENRAAPAGERDERKNKEGRASPATTGEEPRLKPVLLVADLKFGHYSGALAGRSQQGSGAGGGTEFAGGVGAEDAVEDVVDVAELALKIEGVVEILRGKEFGDASIFGDAIAEAGVRFPSGHGVLLDGFVSVVAGHAFFDEVLKELAGENETVSGFEIAEHAFGKNAEFADDLGHFGEHVVDEDGGVWEDDALDTGVRDVALVPEGDVFIGGEHIAADETSEAADLLRSDRIALVGHGGAAALLGGEVLLGFADFSALEMADFESDFFERSGNECENTDVLRVAIALNDLGSDGSDLKAEAAADFFFDIGAEVGGVADGAGDFAKFHVAGGFAEASDIALIFGEPIGDFQS